MAMTRDAIQVRDAAPPHHAAQADAQDVPPGYKRTEVGVIPEDWGVDRFGNLCSVMRGGSPRPIQDYITDSADGINWIKIGDVGVGAKYIDATAEKIVAAGVTRSRYVKVGDFLLSNSMSFGRPYILRTEGCIHDGWLVIQDYHAKFDTEYLYYYLSAETVLAQYTRYAAGSSVLNLNKELVSSIIVAVPAPTEQRAIAEALSDVDGLLGALEALIAKKRAIKQATMQQLLTGRTRLPGFSGRGMAKTEIGEIPKEWSLFPLAKLVDPTRGIRYGIVQPGHYDPNGRYMIRGQDYSEAKGWADPRDVFRVSPSIEEKYRNARVRQSDLIMTIVGYCGHVEMVPSWLDGANLTQTTARIAIKSDHAIPVFCKYVLQSHIGKRQVAGYLKGAAQPGLNCADVEQFLVCLPSRAEQTAIATVLSDMDAEIAALEARRDKTRAIKQGMMQQLLTGRVRLVQPEAAA